MGRSAALVLAGMLIMGVCYGNSVTIGTLVIRQFYGSAHYATKPGHRQLLRHPRVLHRAADRQRASDRLGGDYTTTFLCVLAFAAVDLLVGFWVKKAVRGEAQEKALVGWCPQEKDVVRRG